MNKLILGVATIICSVAVIGCSTIKGIGADIVSVGEAISGGSDHVKESIKNNPPGSKMNSK